MVLNSRSINKVVGYSINEKSVLMHVVYRNGSEELCYPLSDMSYRGIVAVLTAPSFQATLKKNPDHQAIFIEALKEMKEHFSKISAFRMMVDRFIATITTDKDFVFQPHLSKMWNSTLEVTFPLTDEHIAVQSNSKCILVEHESQ